MPVTRNIWADRAAKSRARAEMRKENVRFMAKVAGKKPLTRAKELKKLRKDSKALWSKRIRSRDGKCLMCGKIDTLQAHHWWIRRARSVRLSYDLDNGATLCYGCHMGRIHNDGDGEFISRFLTMMAGYIGVANVDRMTETARILAPVTLEEMREIHERLKTL